MIIYLYKTIVYYDQYIFPKKTQVLVIVKVVNALVMMVSGVKVADVVHVQMNAVDMVYAKVLRSLQMITNHMIQHKM